MKLLLSTLLILGGLMLTQDSYALVIASPGAVANVAPKAYSEQFSVLPCGKIVSNRLGDKINKGSITASNQSSIKQVK